jgi:tetratricopeptide (TPR) repeat protein
MLKRYIVALLLWLLLDAAGYGQVILVDKAADYLKRNELNSAREAIDVAARDQVTGLDPRTWHIRGFVYKELYKNSPQSADFRETALASLRKCGELDAKNAYAARNQAVLEYLYGTYYNEAVEQLNRKEFARSLAGFGKFIDYRAGTKPDEYYAEALYNAGYASYALGDKTAARAYYEKALAANFRNAYLYDDLAQLYGEAGQKDLALRTAEAGRQQYPDDAGLRTTEINLLLASRQFVKAEKNIEDYLRLDPTNTEALLVAGTVYEAIAQSDSTKKEVYFGKRREAYRRALVQDPDNPVANYNMAITLYNKAVDLIEPTQNYDLDIMAFHAKLETITRLFQEALPYAEKASRLAPTNRNALKALQGIYYFLNEKEKSSHVGRMIEQLKG